MEQYVAGINYKGVVTESVAKQIAENIRSSIIEGRLKHNDRLPTETELSERFSVSRPTIREALKRLAAQNLVRSRRGPSGGTFVTHPSLDEARESLTETTTLLVSMGEFDLGEIAEARRNMEMLCARLAVANRREEHLEIMRTELALQESDIDEAAFCASDVRFHRALADATANTLLQFIMATVVEALQPLGNMIIYRIRERAHLVAYHRALHDALLAQDEDSAVRSIVEKMDYLTEQYQRAQDLREEASTGS